MAIRVDAYTSGGLARGILSRAGPLRDVLEHESELVLEGVFWKGLTDHDAEPAGFVTIPMDDLLVAVAEDDPGSRSMPTGIGSALRRDPIRSKATCRRCPASTRAGH